MPDARRANTLHVGLAVTRELPLAGGRLRRILQPCTMLCAARDHGLPRIRALCLSVQRRLIKPLADRRHSTFIAASMHLGLLCPEKTGQRKQTLLFLVTVPAAIFRGAGREGTMPR